MRVTLNRQVYSDLQSIMEYYMLVAGSQMAAKFYREFRLCRRIIAERPKSFPVARNDVRRLNLRRFPYHILYQIIDEKFARILIVKHDRRDPAFGTERR